MEFVEILLTFFAVCSGAIGVASFIISRSKATKEDGEEAGEMASDIKYIKELLIDLRNETKEINNTISSHSIDIAKAQESIKSAHRRIDEAFARIEEIERKV